MKAQIGVVGTGWWATFNHIPTIQNSSEAEIVAICDLDPDRLDKVAGQFGIPAKYQNFNQMLESENLAGVIVSTPHITHTEPAIAALKSKCHVLVEKPMATSARDGWAIDTAARESNREVLVPTGLNFTEYTAKATEWMKSGKIGAVKHVVCQMGSALDDLFAGEPMLETKDHIFRPPASTWADPNKSGGYGWGQMSHSIAWMLYVTGLRFENIYCMDGKSKTGVDYYDAAVGRATNGATISLSGASTVPKHRGMHTDIRIFGTDGMILFDNERARLSLHRMDANDEVVAVSQQQAEYDGALPVKVFAKLCAGHKVTNASNSDCGARVTETLDAMYRSAKSGIVVQIGKE